MATAPLNVPTARQRQALMSRTATVGMSNPAYAIMSKPAAAVMGPFAPAFGQQNTVIGTLPNRNYLAGGTFMQTQPSLSQQSMAARYGATGLAGPTYASMAGGPAEPGPQTGILPNYATLRALAAGGGRNSGWARQELRRMLSPALSAYRQQQAQQTEVEQSRRRGDVNRVIRARREEAFRQAERDRNAAQRPQATPQSNVYSVQFGPSPEVSTTATTMANSLGISTYDTDPIYRAEFGTSNTTVPDARPWSDVDSRDTRAYQDQNLRYQVQSAVRNYGEGSWNAQAARQQYDAFAKNPTARSENYLVNLAALKEALDKYPDDQYLREQWESHDKKYRDQAEEMMRRSPNAVQWSGDEP